MSNRFEELGLGGVWDALAPAINAALDDGHVLPPGAHLADEEADELARRMEDD